MHSENTSHIISPPHVAPLNFWRATKYSSADVDTVCQSVNNECMAARLTFHGEGRIEFSITQRTWDRQQGHFPTVARFFDLIAKHPALKGKTGSMVIWLEDGLWEWQQQYAAKAPTLAFGKQIYDSRTFLMPDPAFIESAGYLEDFKEIREADAEYLWEEKKKTVYWRGAATGLGIEGQDWVKTARGRLCLHAREINNEEILSAYITKASHLEDAQQKRMAEHGVISDPEPFTTFLKYRYQIDADGYCCAWKSLFLKLATQCAVLKIESDYAQWYHHRLEPWKHYIPLHPHLHNFREAYEWLVNNDAEAFSIMQNAHDLINAITFEDSVNEVARVCSQILDCQK